MAADCEEIANVVRDFGGNVMLTNPNHASGSDCIAETCTTMAGDRRHVNVKGDEPEISGAAIDQVVDQLDRNPTAVKATLATPIRTKEKLFDPACVKVVFNEQQLALYFSRSIIPYSRAWNDDRLTSNPPRFFQHIGLYTYRGDFLLRFSSLRRPVIEQLESFELRVLHAGHAILVGIIEEPSIGIDTAADYQEFVERWKARQQLSRA